MFQVCLRPVLADGARPQGRVQHCHQLLLPRQPHDHRLRHHQADRVRHPDRRQGPRVLQPEPVAPGRAGGPALRRPRPGGRDPGAVRDRGRDSGLHSHLPPPSCPGQAEKTENAINSIQQLTIE